MSETVSETQVESVQATTDSAAGTTSSGIQSEYITILSYTKDAIVITFQENADINGFSLISPQGSQVARSPIATGETRTTLSLKSGMEWVPAGTYTLGILGANGFIEEHSISLKPAITVPNIELVKVDPDTEIAGAGNPPAFYATVRPTIKNTGILVSRIVYIGLIEGVLDPNDPPEDSGSQAIMASEKVIAPGKSKTLTVDGLPLRYSRPVGRENTPGGKQTIVQAEEWSEYKTAWCTGKVNTATLLIGGPYIGRVAYTARMKFAGTATRREAGSADIGCTNVSVIGEWTRAEPASRTGNATSDSTTSS